MRLRWNVVVLRSLLCLTFAAVVPLVGCGGDTEPVCEPACPGGTHCTVDGCVADHPGEDDMATGAPAGDMARTCSPACSGATPYCNPNGLCVPCLEDKNCPVGQFCKTFNNTSICVPGCTDDARCGGGSMKCCKGTCTDTSKDTQNCGACDMVCTGINTRAACTAGMCAIGSCNPGWGDCNSNTADGCEVNLHSDAKNCTACGKTCALAHATSDCSNECRIRACDFGWDDCDGKEDTGCELNVLNNNSNCGACGMGCAAKPNAQVKCINAACQLTSCNIGFTDCDGNAANGCEVNIASDASNCGMCGNRCGQGLICAQGICTCPNCNLPNAKSTCVNLKCVVAQCNINYGDCDGLPQNGCELNLTSDANNCGQCGVVCAQGLVCVNGSCTCPNCVRPNAKTVCVNNQCMLDSCFNGFGNCDGNAANGCEADFSMDNSNCGGCGMPCQQGNTCLQGMCQAFRSKIMLCGTSGRPINVFIPQGMMFASVSSCAPDNDTQAMFITRTWNNGIQAQALQNYLNAGGVVLTEYNISQTAYNLAFGTNAAQGARFGGCDDTLPCVAQLSPNDPFWQANQFKAGGAGCGYAVQGYPGITPICGWDAQNASVGYRDLGNGRFWATDFDWQDNQAYPMGNTTIPWMGYMMTHRR